MKMMRAYQMPTELRGPDSLDHLADMIFGDSDPSELYATESPIRFEYKDGFDLLILKMPFVTRDKIDLFRGENDNLIIEVGSHKRTVTLPLTLKDTDVIGGTQKRELTVKLKRRKPIRQTGDIMAGEENNAKFEAWKISSGRTERCSRNFSKGQGK